MMPSDPKYFPAGNRIGELSRRLRQLERSHRPLSRAKVTTGCRALDRLLPGRGLVRGSLVEWLGDGPGSGAGTLALVAAREACRSGGLLIVVDRDGTFYPPAAAVWGTDLQNTMVVRPENDKDECWSLDQALRCRHVAAVVAWPSRLDAHTFRRLQLAAEDGGCLGLFVRPQAVRGDPSWADLQLSVSPQASQAGWRLVVQLLRCRGRFGKSEIELEINDRTGEIHEAHSGNPASQLARPEASEHSA